MTARELAYCAAGGALVGLGAALILTGHAIAFCRHRAERVIR